MANYNTSNNEIENPLNMKRIDNRYCPICGADTWGAKIKENHYKLNLILWNGNPCTQVSERKDLSIDMCFKCRNKIYNVIKNSINEMKK